VHLDLAVANGSLIRKPPKTIPQYRRGFPDIFGWKGAWILGHGISSLNVFFKD
jgi:hypothetical protein